MGPMGSYLYFVLYVIPYPQHHNPKHRLRQTEGERDSYTHARMEDSDDSWTVGDWPVQAAHTGKWGTIIIC